METKNNGHLPGPDGREDGPRFLIVKISAMGDIVNAFPVARAIKRGIPGAVVDWIVSDAYTELVRLCPDVDDLIPFRRRDWGKWWRPTFAGEALAFIQKTREKRYDAVIDLQGLLRSGVVTWLTRAPVKAGFGYAREGAAVFYNRKIISPGPEAHAIDRYMGALAALGMENGGMGYNLAIPPEAASWARENLPSEPYVVLNPNTRWKTKRWPVERFGLLAKELEKRRGLRSVIVGAAEDERRCQAVARAAGLGAVNIAGQAGFSRLAAALGGARAVFTNDSGPMHLAVAMGAPVVAVFGPTNPARTGPHGPGAAAVRADVPCSPCYKRRCPESMECMTKITIPEVIAAWEGLEKRLNGGQAPAESALDEESPGQGASSPGEKLS
ncbi:MAG: lipopolysaccharide heptosyltransferase I [Candidatus Nitrospinota bacterium M3_3B_026]